ncbi:ArsR/SmtB family transcription factor [Shinella sp. BYT-45]|uniref:ArsR/SmtB family transcription factor n=1 Tax=Shinella sp. BYT-45 TaxID=3377377 RepID=UPI00397F0F6F
MDATLLSERELTKIGKALAEPRRVRILQELGAAVDTTMACSALVSIEDVSASTATHHMQELENAGLVEISRQGKFSFITFRREKLAAYLEHLARI